MAGTRGPFHAPPQLKPRVRGEERKEKARGFTRGTHGHGVQKCGKGGTQCCSMSFVEKEKVREPKGMKDDRAVSEEVEKDGGFGS